MFSFDFAAIARVCDLYALWCGHGYPSVFTLRRNFLFVVVNFEEHIHFVYEYFLLNFVTIANAYHFDPIWSIMQVVTLNFRCDRRKYRECVTSPYRGLVTIHTLIGMWSMVNTFKTENRDFFIQVDAWLC